jgi:hypothetical protein
MGHYPRVKKDLPKRLEEKKGPTEKGGESAHIEKW